MISFFSIIIYLNDHVDSLFYTFAIEDSCVTFDSKTRLISITCKSIRLSDIDKQLNNASIIEREDASSYPSKFNPVSKDPGNKKWILNAGIVVEKNASLVIDSYDTTWLKIIPVVTTQSLTRPNTTEIEKNISSTTGNNSIPIPSNFNGKENYILNDLNKNKLNKDTGKVFIVKKDNSNNPNGIHVRGSLEIDSVKITSWDPKKNDVIKFDLGKRPGEEHTKSKYDTVEPRPFIRVSREATGTTNITNSELAYLGYSCSKCSGISYYGGVGSVIKGNDIHHLLKGFYSNGMGHMLIEDNDFHDNYLYGIDPHTGTHDMIIRNNNVYSNNASAIVCSKNCYNILIEGNEIFNNRGPPRGIAFSINMDHSIARNNYVHDQITCIGFNRGSDYNKVYNNTLSNCNIAINLEDTSNNWIYNNKIVKAQDAIILQNVTNKIFDNQINNSSHGVVFIYASNNNGTINTDINNDNETRTDFLDRTNSENKFMYVKNPVFVRNMIINNASELAQAGYENE